MSLRPSLAGALAPAGAAPSPTSVFPKVRVAARAIFEHPWARPVGKVIAVALALVVLSAIGSSALANGKPPPAPPALASAPDAAPREPPVVALTETIIEAPRAGDAGAPEAPPPRAPPTGRATPESPVTLNTATLEDLRRLPGIGPKKAEAILALRTKLGKFRRAEDLLRVKGIGRGTFKKLRPLVRVDEGEARP